LAERAICVNFPHDAEILRIPEGSSGCGCYFPRFQAKTALGMGIAKVFLEMF
jgi:hypothetical protein